MPTDLVLAEYIWLDGSRPQQLRSKTKALHQWNDTLDQLPMWGFDGSSTGQATGHDSDCLLKPVSWVYDPLRGKPNILVLCEVLNKDGSPHVTNTRRHLRAAMEKFGQNHQPLAGIEQEYILFANKYNDGEHRPWGWPRRFGRPEPQGPYYCGVGANKVAGRKLVETHLKACLDAGLLVDGINAEVMLGQWEFQVGPADPLTTSDQLWLARWLLHRLGEEYDIVVSLEPKPMSGNWNGSGGHINFSTLAMREPNGLKVIEAACEKLGQKHREHIVVYGDGNEKRLTGQHETCNIDQFRWGASDRGASVRLPPTTVENNLGYLEDRRPAANVDPYLALTALLTTICGDGFDPKTIA